VGGEPTFAQARMNGKVAPIPDLHTLALGRHNVSERDPQFAVTAESCGRGCNAFPSGTQPTMWRCSMRSRPTACSRYWANGHLTPL